MFSSNDPIPTLRWGEAEALFMKMATTSAKRRMLPLLMEGAQAGAVPDAERRDEGAGLYRSGHVGRELRADPVGLGRLGSILIVFGVAAAAAWILTAAAGAEQFAFVLQKLRYGS
nr:hypothetical protein [Brevundimonas diminuta]